MKYIGNAFSLQMIDGNQIHIDEITLEDVIKETKTNLTSIIGHADTANVVSDMIGINIQVNRQSIVLNPGDELIVAQLSGGRLPEGSTKLPEGFILKWKKVTCI